MKAKVCQRLQKKVPIKGRVWGSFAIPLGLQLERNMKLRKNQFPRGAERRVD
jgi:hypothetical protein